MNATGQGGALYIEAVNADLVNSIFSQCYVIPTLTNNTKNAQDWSYGGALCMKNTGTTAATLDLSFVEFTACEGWNGSAVYVDAFSLNLSYTTFTNCATNSPVNVTTQLNHTTSIIDIADNGTAISIALDPVLFSETLTPTFYLLYGPATLGFPTTAGAANLYLSIPLPVNTTIANFSSPAIPVASGMVMLLNVSSYTFTTAAWPYDVATFLDTTAVAAATATVTPSATAAPALSTVAIVFIVIAVIIVLVGIILAIVLVVRKGFGGPGGCCGRSSHVRGAKIVTYF